MNHASTSARADDSSLSKEGAAGAATTTPVPGAFAALLGWTIIAALELVMMATRHYGGTAPAFRVAEAYALQLGGAMAVGIASATVIAAWVGARRALIQPGQEAATLVADGAALLFVAGWFSYFFLRADFDPFASRKGGELGVVPWHLRTACVLGLAIAVTTSMLIGRLLARWRLRFVGVALALAAAVANYFFLRGDYFNLHFADACLSVSLFASSLAGVRVPKGEGVRRAGAGALAAAVALGAYAMWRPPPPGVAARMLTTRCNPFALLLVARGYHGVEARAVIPPEQAAWFTPRRDLPPIPSKADPEVAERAIVLLLTVDAFRLEALEDERHEQLLPTMRRMRREGVHFTRAYSPGSQTVYTLPSWFTGKYYSELLWKPRKKSELIPWPVEDPTPGFPALLDEQGIPSTFVVAGSWLGARSGIARGFSSYVDLKIGGQAEDYARARDMAEVVIDRLEDQGAGSLFVFAHFMDAHLPYQETPGGSNYSKYLRELGFVDTAIGRIWRRVEELGLSDRTTIILSADHGEAFGEHGLNFHANSQYDELIHVPLVVVGPGYPARDVDALVSTIDFGPTILDILGVDTPGWMMGQSLREVLEGGVPNFTRPIVSENRLRQAMIFPDGVKVTRDLHFGDGDAYDLKTDPKELDNRIDDPTFDTKNRFALLNAFFRAHALRTKTYKAPYRW